MVVPHSSSRAAKQGEENNGFRQLPCSGTGSLYKFASLHPSLQQQQKKTFEAAGEVDGWTMDGCNHGLLLRKG